MLIVLFGVVLARLFDVLRGVDQLTVGHNRVIGRLFEISRPVILGCGAMVFCRMLQKFRGL